MNIGWIDFSDSDRKKTMDVREDMFPKYDFHVHFPAGAVPKDGPSAGITITTSLISLLIQQPIPERLAMTGEITLTGNVLPVGGIKEKVIAAKRAGARTLVMCSKNRRDVDELPAHIKEGLTFFFVDHYKEVFQFLFKKGAKVDLNNLPKNVLYTPKGTAKNSALTDGDDESVSENSMQAKAENKKSQKKSTKNVKK